MLRKPGGRAARWPAAWELRSCCWLPASRRPLRGRGDRGGVLDGRRAADAERAGGRILRALRRRGAGGSDEPGRGRQVVDAETVGRRGAAGQAVASSLAPEWIRIGTHWPRRIRHLPGPPPVTLSALPARLRSQRVTSEESPIAQPAATPAAPAVTPLRPRSDPHSGPMRSVRHRRPGQRRRERPRRVRVLAYPADPDSDDDGLTTVRSSQAGHQRQRAGQRRAT